MNAQSLITILAVPLGIIKKVVELGKEGSRDIQNSHRFKRSTIDSGCCINSHSKISDHVHLLSNTIVNFSEIDSYTYVGKNCLIQHTTIGKFCSIANDVLIGLGRHPIDNFSTSPLFYRINNPLDIKLINKTNEFKEYLPIEIGHDVWIGTRAVILDGLKIGTGAIVAANSVVTKDVPPYAIVGGVPAKIIKYRFSDEKINKLLQAAWWQQDINQIKTNLDELNTI